MVILGEKGRNAMPHNIILRAASYDTVRTRTVLPLHKIKTAERDIMSQRMVRITKIPDDNDICILNPESPSGI